jgi:hypothetical protein
MTVCRAPGIHHPCGPTTPFFPASGPATRSFNGLHPKSKFLALVQYLEDFGITGYLADIIFISK